MMNEEMLKEALIEAYDIEFADLDRRKLHIFSRNHKRKMRKLFNSLYNANSDTYDSHPRFRLRHRLSLVFILIITSILLGITVVAIATNGFKFSTKPTHTQVLSAGWEDAPILIEQYYNIDVPEGYSLYNEKTDSNLIYSIEYRLENDFIKLKQYAKKSFNATYNTEGYDYEELYINNHNAFYISWDDYNALVWDNGDYILEIQSTLNKDYLVNLSKSAKIFKK